MGAIGIAFERREKAADFAGSFRVTEHGKREGCFRDENVAIDRLEGFAGRVRPRLVIARGDDAHALPFDGDLRRSENVAGGMEADGDIADVDDLAILGGLRRLGVLCAIADRHDVECLAGRHHMAVARPGVIGVAVGDQRLLDRTHRVDIEIARGAVEPFRTGMEKIFKTQRHAA